MIFLLIDYIISVAISMGVWIVYKSAGGIYYSTKWLIGNKAEQISEKEYLELNQESVILMTEEEYLKLINNKEQLRHIEDKLQKIEEKIQ